MQQRTRNEATSLYAHIMKVYDGLWEAGSSKGERRKGKNYGGDKAQVQVSGHRQHERAETTDGCRCGVGWVDHKGGFREEML